MSQDNNPSGPIRPSGGSSGGPMAERMQALLSRAAEDQLTEQRQVSSVLADLRQLVAGLSEQLRGTASSERVESLAGEVSGLVSELRSSSGRLGERLDSVGRRIEEQAATTSGIVADSGAGTAGIEQRVAELGSQVTAQEAALSQLQASLAPLATTPDDLAALQSDAAGLQERLQALGDTLTQVGQMSQVRSDLAVLRGDVQQLGARLAQMEVPTPDAIAAAVAAQSEHLVDEVAPRVADLVLTRLGDSLVEQIATSVTTAVQSGLSERVRAATADSELRISAHVDEAILALAEALLRRRRSSRGSVLAGVTDPVAVLPEAEPADEPEAESESSASVLGDGTEAGSAGAGSAQAGSGEAGSGEAGSGEAGSAEAASGEAGSEEAGGPDAEEDVEDAPQSGRADTAPPEDEDPADADAAEEPASAVAVADDPADADAGAGLDDMAQVDRDGAEDDDAHGDDGEDLHREDLAPEDTRRQDLAPEDTRREDTGPEDLDDDAHPDQSRLPDDSGLPKPWERAESAQPAAPKVSARTALEELLAGRQAWGYRAEMPATEAAPPATAPPAASTSADSASLVDTSKAPAPSPRAYTRAGVASADQGAEDHAGTAAEGPADAAGAGHGLDDDWFDEDHDGPRRRPWWRPGG